MLMMALGFVLKSETPGLIERSTLACPSHIKDHESLNSGQTHWVLSVTHSATARKGNLSQGARTAKKACMAFIISLLDVGGKLSVFLILVHPHFTRHQNLKTHNGSERLTMKIGLRLIHCNGKTRLLQNLVRKIERWEALLILQLPIQKDYIQSKN